MERGVEKGGEEGGGEGGGEGGWKKGGGEGGVEGECRRGVEKGGAEGGESYFFFFYPTLTTIQIKIFLYVIPKLKIYHLSDSVYDVDVMV